MENETAEQYQVAPELLVVPRRVRLKRFVVVTNIVVCIILSPIFFMTSYLFVGNPRYVCTLLIGTPVVATVDDKWVETEYGGDDGYYSVYRVGYRYLFYGESHQGQATVSDDYFDMLDVRREPKLALNISPIDPDYSVVARPIAETPMAKLVAYIAVIIGAPWLYWRRLLRRKAIYVAGLPIPATLSSKLETVDSDGTTYKLLWTVSIPAAGNGTVLDTETRYPSKDKFEVSHVGDQRTALYDPNCPTRYVFYDEGEFEIISSSNAKS